MRYVPYEISFPLYSFLLNLANEQAKENLWQIDPPFLSSLLIVIGVQIIAIGLIGEIIIFTHAKDLKEYKIDRIRNFDIEYLILKK